MSHFCRNRNHNNCSFKWFEIMNFFLGDIATLQTAISKIKIVRWKIRIFHMIFTVCFRSLHNIFGIQQELFLSIKKLETNCCHNFKSLSFWLWKIYGHNLGKLQDASAWSFSLLLKVFHDTKSLFIENWIFIMHY